MAKQKTVLTLSNYPKKKLITNISTYICSIHFKKTVKHIWYKFWKKGGKLKGNDFYFPIQEFVCVYTEDNYECNNCSANSIETCIRLLCFSNQLNPIIELLFLFFFHSMKNNCLSDFTFLRCILDINCYIL